MLGILRCTVSGSTGRVEVWIWIEIRRGGTALPGSPGCGCSCSRSALRCCWAAQVCGALTVLPPVLEDLLLVQRAHQVTVPHCLALVAPLLPVGVIHQPGVTLRAKLGRVVLVHIHHATSSLEMFQQGLRGGKIQHRGGDVVVKCACVCVWGGGWCEVNSLHCRLQGEGSSCCA